MIICVYMYLYIYIPKKRLYKRTSGRRTLRRLILRCVIEEEKSETVRTGYL